MKRWKKLICAGLCCVVAFGAQAQGGSPEQAIDTFFVRLKALDVNGMMDCFATDVFVDHHDFKRVTKRQGVISPGNIVLPGKFAAYKALNKVLRRGEVAAQIRGLLVLISSKDDSWMNAQVVETDEAVDRYVESINPAGAAKLTVLSVEDAEKLGNLPRHRNWADRFNAEDVAERVAMVKVPSGTYVIPFTLFKYENAWYIDHLASPTLGVSHAERVPEEKLKGRRAGAGVSGL